MKRTKCRCRRFPSNLPHYGQADRCAELRIDPDDGEIGAGSSPPGE
jgi:hypothetical protein